MWKIFFIGMLRICSSFYSIFLDFFIIFENLNLWTVNPSDFLIRFGPNPRWISVKTIKFVNPALMTPPVPLLRVKIYYRLRTLVVISIVQHLILESIDPWCPSSLPLSILGQPKCDSRTRARSPLQWQWCPSPFLSSPFSTIQRQWCPSPFLSPRCRCLLQPRLQRMRRRGEDASFYEKMIVVTEWAPWIWWVHLSLPNSSWLAFWFCVWCSIEMESEVVKYSCGEFIYFSPPQKELD
jgi:hypothetical protein